MSTAAQITANQANGKLSTGPQTEAGKSASSKNNFRHGLSGAFVIHSSENLDHYDQLLDGLRAQHNPADPTEALLVERMAQHWWLGQRALQMQELCFHEKALMVRGGCEQEFALYLRYQATHERAFSKCLNELAQLRAGQMREERTQELQRRQEAAERRKQEMHDARVEAIQTKTEIAKAKAAPVVKQPAAPPVLSSIAGPFDSVPGYKQRVQEMFALDAEREAELQAFLSQQNAA